MIEKTTLYEIEIDGVVRVFESKKDAKIVAESLKILYKCDKVICKETITKTSVVSKEIIL